MTGIAKDLGLKTPAAINFVETKQLTPERASHLEELAQKMEEIGGADSFDAVVKTMGLAEVRTISQSDLRFLTHIYYQTLASASSAFEQMAGTQSAVNSK